MNKKLLAVALATAFAAPAMAEGVQIYGAFDVGALYRGHHYELSSGLNGHNGLGFKMSEDLGNGMTISGDAFFQFALDAGGNITGSGQNAGNGGFNTLYSYLALSGDFGTLIAGRAGGARGGFIKQYDAFGGFGVGSALQAQQGGADYADNAVAYVSPELVPGLKVLLAYTSNLTGQDFSNHAGRNGKANPLWAVAGLYNQGPISLTAAYEKAFTYVGPALDVETVGGSYDFGVAKVMALYTRIETANRGWQVGATAPVGAATLKAGYVNSYGGSGSCKKYAVGANYDLSKRTRLYADAAKATDSDGCLDFGPNGGTYSGAANTAIDGSGPSPVSSGSSYGFNVGVRHTF
jgi:predicted porin